MGLDWNPGNRPKAGHGAEYATLVVGIRANLIKTGSPEHRRFFEISQSAHETLNAPRVGRDANANEWIRRKYHQQKQPAEMTEEEWVGRFNGFHVLELATPCDGLPHYCNGEMAGNVELFPFRAQFLKDCAEIMGRETLNAAWESKFAAETVAYGQELIRAAKTFAQARNISLDHLNTDDINGIEFKLDIVLAAGRWCIFWGERGHLLDAYW